MADEQAYLETSSLLIHPFATGGECVDQIIWDVSFFWATTIFKNVQLVVGFTKP